MKTVNLAQNISLNLPTVAEHHSFPEQGNQVRLHPATQSFYMEPKAAEITRNKATVKSVTSYLFDALVEGVKQNFLGSDINMEFLVLSIRVYLIVLIGLTVSYSKHQAIDQYSEKRNSVSNYSNDDRSIISLKLTA
jgi:hypothetical protein